VFLSWMRGHTWSRVRHTLPVSDTPRDVSKTTPAASHTPRDQTRDRLDEEKDAALSSWVRTRSHVLSSCGWVLAVWCEYVYLLFVRRATERVKGRMRPSAARTTYAALSSKDHISWDKGSIRDTVGDNYDSTSGLDHVKSLRMCLHGTCPQHTTLNRVVILRAGLV
jgi:hypothetical protein